MFLLYNMKISEYVIIDYSLIFKELNKNSNPDDTNFWISPTS